jgi:HTH-type transcriptional regulator/antitoxin HigA
MSNIKPIRNDEDYKAALESIESLILASPEDGSEDSDRIAVLSTLIEDYEKTNLPDYNVDPIEAIKFRMEQLSLKNVDLVPYLGSKSRVSEILSGKRSLTVKMIKSLEEGLGIPASSLVGSSGIANLQSRWTPKIVNLMIKRGYFEYDLSLNYKRVVQEGLLTKLLSSGTGVPQTALLRQTSYRDANNVDKFLMQAWSCKVKVEASNVVQVKKIRLYEKKLLTIDFINELIKLSINKSGPLEAIDRLAEIGIVVVIEPPLPQTRLDGATIFLQNNPIIGLTLRHDRLDNFWFTLLHELAHVYLHYDSDVDSFYDNLDVFMGVVDGIEAEADKLAGELLIPSSIWQRSPVRNSASPSIIRAFAKSIGVHEAIVAGRIRYDSREWSQYTEIVNSTKIRKLFVEKVW